MFHVTHSNHIDSIHHREHEPDFATLKYDDEGFADAEHNAAQLIDEGYVPIKGNFNPVAKRLEGRILKLDDLGLPVWYAVFILNQ